LGHITTVQANDFRRQWDDLRDDALAAFEKVGASGWYVLGEEVRLFEQDLAAL
jgi:dTDP-4-amino-4,6-dideoxygalactose transaminase